MKMHVRVKPVLLAALIAGASPLCGQTAGSAGTAQQQFDAGSAALDAGEWDRALGIYDALEKRLKPSPSLGLVRLRKGEALVALARMEEAAASIRLGLQHVDEKNASHHEDLARANFVLGKVSENALDYVGALAHYRAAERLSNLDAWRLKGIAAQVRTEAFFDAPAAVAHADRAMALATEMKADERTIGGLEILKGRALLNAGRFKEAETILLSAVKRNGGLTRKVDAADLASRSDLAIASLLGGDDEAGRRYMAYTGAGQLPDAFTMGAEMVPPSCAEHGLSPEDVAVVEFGVGSDGAVSSAFPIYASRQGESALAFARAVSRWSWTPEQVTKIPPLFRAMTRIEMRCSTADERPSITQLLQGDFDSWVTAQGLGAMEESRSDAVALPLEQAELARREAAHGPSDARLLPPLLALADNLLTPVDQRPALYGRALDIARRAEAPGTVIALLSAWQRTGEAQAKGDWDTPDQSPLLNDPAVARDPRARAAVLLMQSDALLSRKKRTSARPLLEQVKAIPGLDRLDPFRVGALIRLAGIDAAEGELASARAAYEETGLSEQQCALVDVQPVRTRSGGSANDFPNDALRWGFEGWAVPEFDVTAKGESVNVRTTIAYPPFIFGPASEKIVDRFRYSQSYRPEGSLGCGGLRQSIGFRVPR